MSSGVAVEGFGNGSAAKFLRALALLAPAVLLSLPAALLFAEDKPEPEKDAYEMEAARPYYDAYHKAVSDARKAVQKEWGRGLLLDVHGQGAEAEAIFRGTGDGVSVKHLGDRFGKEAVTGPRSVLGVL